MQIENNKVVTFFYRLSEEGGEELESNHEALPMAYLHGHRNILRGLEAGLNGKQAGDKLSIRLAPEEAYGPRREEATQKVPIKHLASKHKKLRPGMLVKVNGEKGIINASVIKAGKFMVDLDMNHPFAGKTLIFDIEIKEVRDATPDELSHGHAHGEGGHHH